MDNKKAEEQLNTPSAKADKKSFGQRLPDRTRKVVNILGLALLPLIVFFSLELLFNGRIGFQLQVHILNYVLYLATLLALVGITGRLKRGSRIFLILMWAIGCINYLVLATRMTPVVPWDIYGLTTGLRVASNYRFPLTPSFIAFTALFIALFVLASFFTWQAKKRSHHVIAALLGLVIFSSSMGFAMRPETKEEFNLYTVLFVTRHMASTNGFLLNFVHSMHYLKVEAPPEYSVERVEEIEQNYQDLLGSVRLKDLGVRIASNESSLGSDSGTSAVTEKDNPNQENLLTLNSPELDDLSEIARYLAVVNQKSRRTLAPGEKPDVVVVMNETFSDLRTVKDFETNKEMLPFFSNVRENTIKGTAHASVIGGGTATSEFEFLTGSTMAFLPSGSSPYQQYIYGPTPSLVSLLEEQGYGSVAMHPYHSRGWNRHEVYPYFGFNKSKFLYDFRNNHELRNYISDESAFREIELELNQASYSDQPHFVFTVTMQNHGGYSADHENFDPQIHITSQKGTNTLNNYLSLVHESDRALGEFLARMKTRARPTIVLFFGDHQPSDEAAGPLLDGQDLTTLTESRREVPFLLWANYDIPEESGLESSLNFLSNLILENAGLEPSPWHAFLKDVSEEIPVMNDAYYHTNDGETHILTEGAELPDLMKDYEIIQYNYLFDLPNRVDELFMMIRH